MIFVMEKKHKQRLLEKFPDNLFNKRVHVLDIPDEYGYMDEELIEHIRVTVDAILYRD